MKNYECITKSTTKRKINVLSIISRSKCETRNEFKLLNLYF